MFGLLSCHVPSSVARASEFDGDGSPGWGGVGAALKPAHPPWKTTTDEAIKALSMEASSMHPVTGFKVPSCKHLTGSSIHISLAIVLIE